MWNNCWEQLVTTLYTLPFHFIFAQALNMSAIASLILQEHAKQMHNMKTSGRFITVMHKWINRHKFYVWRKTCLLPLEENYKKIFGIASLMFTKGIRGIQIVPWNMFELKQFVMRHFTLLPTECRVHFGKREPEILNMHTSALPNSWSERNSNKIWISLTIMSLWTIVKTKEKWLGNCYSFEED